MSLQASKPRSREAPAHGLALDPRWSLTEASRLGSFAAQLPTTSTITWSSGLRVRSGTRQSWAG